MLAMDVVDTLRHQDKLVEQELDETRREADLIERLRRLYRGQGIEVPDRVLQEGVRALRESRFVYTPPPDRFATRLARLWVERGRYGRRFLALVMLAGLGAGGYYAGMVRPAQQQAEEARVRVQQEQAQLTELLPRALQQGHAEAVAEAKEDEARQRADRVLAEGQAALARRDAVGARQALGELEVLRSELRQEYVLRIVSRPGEPSGVWRIPARNRTARNYYVIVEPVAPDGRILTLPVTSEEDGKTERVSRWGVRVTEDVFDAVRRDKNDDGIVERNRLGEKKRGRLAVDYLMPVSGGAILTW